MKWQIIGQELLSYNGRNIDKIKIETTETTDEEIITLVENYYFDITDCFENDFKDEGEFDESSTLALISKRIKALEHINDFNRDCIGLLRKDQLLNNTKLTLGFLDIIFKDESLPLFESMMKNKNMPILNVLRAITPQLK